MNSIRKQYATIVPLFVFFLFTIKQMWELSFLAAIALVFMLFYLESYRKIKEKFNGFYIHVAVYCIATVIFALTKVFGVFDTVPVYFMFFVFFIYALFLFSKMNIE